MRFFLQNIALLSVFLFCSCAKNLYQPILIEQEITTEFYAVKSNPAAEEQNLLRVIKGNEDWSILVKDLLLGLEAEEAEQSGKFEDSASRWLSIIQGENSFFGDKALLSWAKSYSNIQGSQVNSNDLAQALLNSTQNGQASIWLQKSKLVKIERLEQKIAEVYKSSRVIAAEQQQFQDPPKKMDESLWLDLSMKTCNLAPNDAWKSWRENLSREHRNYWDALSFMCQKKYLEAKSILMETSKYLERMDNSKKLHALVLEQIIVCEKRLGLRDEVANAYLKLSLLLGELEKSNRGPMGMPFEAVKRKADVDLWVARTQALKGNYEIAQEAVESCLRSLSISLTNLTGTQKAVLLDLKVEAYHTQASRISYEKNDFSGALRFNRMGQALQGISSDWTERLRWAEAWYLYKLKDLNAAVLVWESILGESKADIQRARVLYWLGRTYESMGQESNSKDRWEQLRSEFPLSFYTVVALARHDAKYSLGRRFPSSQELRHNFSAIKSFKAPLYLADKEANLKLRRLELCLKAQVKTFLGQVSGDVFRYVSSHTNLLKDQEATLYVSQLLFFAGEFQLSMALLNQLSQKSKDIWDDYPHQLITFFPSPYFEIYEQASVRNGIHPSLPLAISRQESSFTADAESPAEAYGLMQLIMPTAVAQSEILGFDWPRSSSALKSPQVNIKIGAAYLARLGRHYNGKWYQAFAAYNAGEYVVDAWVNRRASADPIEWIEGVSFGETMGYVRNVWRNWELYKYILGTDQAPGV